MPKFDPPYTPNPLIYKHENWHVITSAISLDMQNLARIVSQGASLQIR